MFMGVVFVDLAQVGDQPLGNPVGAALLRHKFAVMNREKTTTGCCTAVLVTVSGVVRSVHSWGHA